MSEEKMKIFVFENEVNPLGLSLVAISEEGLIITGHLSSTQRWAMHDMGFTSNWKHDEYNEYAPQGWELEYIAHEDFHSHEELQKAVNKMKERKEKGLSTSWKKASMPKVEITFSSGKAAE